MALTILNASLLSVTTIDKTKKVHVIAIKMYIAFLISSAYTED